MAGNRGIIVKVGERGPAYQMVRITGYKQFPSANIVMWVMNGRALNKHAAREALRLVQRALRNTVWIRKWFRPPRGSHCSHGLPGKWNIRSRHLWTWKKNERLESFEKKRTIRSYVTSFLSSRFYLNIRAHLRSILFSISEISSRSLLT